MGIAGLLVGSIAYYRIVVSGSIEGSTGNALIDVNAYAIISYTESTQSIAEAIKNECNSSSKITLKQI